MFHKWVRWKLWQMSIKPVFLNIRVGIRVRGLHLVQSLVTFTSVCSNRFEEGGAEAFGGKGPVVQKRLADYEAINSANQGWVKGCHRHPFFNDFSCFIHSLSIEQFPPNIFSLAKFDQHPTTRPTRKCRTCPSARTRRCGLTCRQRCGQAKPHGTF